MSLVVLMGCNTRKTTNNLNVNNENESKKKLMNEETTYIVEDSQKKLDINDSKRFQLTKDNVIFDVNIELPKDIDLYNIKKSIAKKKIININSAKSVLKPNKNILENGDTDTKNYISFSAESTLRVDETLFYSMPIYDKYKESFSLNHDENLEEVVFQKNKDLENIDSKLAMNNIFNCINDIGYELDCNAFDFFTLDYESLQKASALYDSMDLKSPLTDKKVWTREDNAYYFFAEQIYQGLPIYFGMYDFPQDYIFYRPIQAIYSTRGLESLVIDTIYSFTEENQDIEFIDYETVANTIANKYGNIITNSKFKVVRSKLYLIPIKDQKSEYYNVKPAWLFEVEESGKDSTGEIYNFTLYSFVDAESGKELIF